MKLSSNLLTSVTLIAFALLLFSCKKQATEEKKISFKELYDLYSKASVKLHELKA